jgi:hypothetical protein
MTGTWAGIAANTSFELTVDSQNGRSFAGIGRIMNEEGDWETFPILGSIEADGSVKFAQQGGGHSFRGNYKGMRTSGTVTLADGSTGKFSVIR